MRPSILPSTFASVGIPDMNLYGAQWLAYVLPYRRFAATLASGNARLGAGADRYSFTVVDLHLLLSAGLCPAHQKSRLPAHWIVKVSRRPVVRIGDPGLF